MRVHELAKELNVNNKEVITACNELGISAKSSLSTLDDKAVAAIKKAISASVAKAEKTKAEKAPAPKTEHKTAEKAKPAAAKTEIPKEPAKKAEPVKHVKPVEPAPAAAPEQKPPAPVKAAEKKPATEAPKQGHAPAKTEHKAVVPQKPAQPTPPPAPAPKVDDKVIKFKGTILVRELAERIGVRPNKLVAELMSWNVFASINERLDINITKKIAEKYGFTVDQIKRSSEQHMPLPKKDADDEAETDKPEDLQPRPPVVTFLGHVDHGKTSLLDKIRNAAVAKGEFGGITQHIGAYSVEAAGRKITFLDTPGHEAFTAMRARGANMTDIAVIIIAADDGIMPQTKEAISHAKAAGVSIMVAINKCDLPSAQPERVKQQMGAEGLTPEDWGGDVICCPVSAITGQGIDHLLEMILLQTEVLELKANPKRRAKGFVVEAKLEPGMGPTTTLLVTNGTLKVGDILLCGQHWGRVKALVNDQGKKVVSAGPSTPIKCMGLSGVPEAGADFKVVQNDKIAREISEQTAQKLKDESLNMPKRVSLLNLFDHIKESEKKELRMILKTDTQGSVEAIVHALNGIKSTKVTLNIIHSATGNITVNDVMLASASDAIIMGFHIGKEPGVDATARHEGIDIRNHQIIYDLTDEVEKAMVGLLVPEFKQRIIGHAVIKQVFPLSKNSKVAGCYINDGKITNKARVRVIRNNENLFEGKIESLQHFQNEASEIKAGQECGLRISNYRDFIEGDFLELYELEEIKQSL